MTDTIPRRIARFIVDALLLVAVSPLVGFLLLAAGIQSAWQRFELWAYYRGDVKARDRDLWRRR